MTSAHLLKALEQSGFPPDLSGFRGLVGELDEGISRDPDKPFFGSKRDEYISDLVARHIGPPYNREKLEKILKEKLPVVLPRPEFTETLSPLLHLRVPSGPALVQGKDPRKTKRVPLRYEVYAQPGTTEKLFRPVARTTKSLSMPQGWNSGNADSALLSGAALLGTGVLAGEEIGLLGISAAEAGTGLAWFFAEELAMGGFGAILGHLATQGMLEWQRREGSVLRVLPAKVGTLEVWEEQAEEISIAPAVMAGGEARNPSSRPIALAGSTPATPPEPGRGPRPEPPRRERRVANNFWWRPMAVPREVDQAIRSEFLRTDISFAEVYMNATEIMLRWHISAIPNARVRQEIETLLQEARTGAIFQGRRYQTMEDVEASMNDFFAIFSPAVREAIGNRRTMGAFREAGRLQRTGGEPMQGASFGELLSKTLSYTRLRRALNTNGSIVGGAQGFWVHPLYAPVGSPYRALVISHEVGHYAALHGAAGLWGRTLHNYKMGILANIPVNPLSPVTRRAMTYGSEGYSLGMEWEVLSRIPSSVRLREQARIREELGRHADFLDARTFSEGVKIVRRHYPTVEERDARRDEIVPAVNMARFHHALGSAVGSKSQYLRWERPPNSYSVRELLFSPIYIEHNFCRREEVPKDFWMARILWGLSATATAAYLLWPEDED